MRPIIAASLVIGAIAAATPGIVSRYVGEPAAARRARPSTETADTRAAAAVEAKRSGVAGPRQVEIEAESDGHFYVEAAVNFRPIRLMVDTGATVVALRASDAVAAGIRLRDSDYVHPVQTANGTTKAAEATLESVAVDMIEVRNVRALVIPDDRLGVSLLGGSFLHGLDRFEIADGRLVFED